MKIEEAKIVIADDHVLFRDGLVTLIELGGIGKVVGEASNGSELLQLLKSVKTDLVIIDIDMPVMNGIEATQLALQKMPDLNILVVTMFSDKKYYLDMIYAGAKGFVLKTSTKKELEEAINTVLKGGTYFSKDLMDEIIKNFNSPQKQNVNPNNEILFNTKEIEILEFMIKGLSAKEISEKLDLTSKTVSNYKTLMLEKTGCKNSIELIVYALKANIIQL